MVTVSPPKSEASASWAYALQLPNDPLAPRIARTTLRAVLTGHGMPQLADTAELLASELVTNAYRYSTGPATLRLRALGGTRLRVSVWDANPHIPLPSTSAPATRSTPSRPRRMADVGCSSYAITRTRGVATRSAMACSGRAGSCCGASWGRRLPTGPGWSRERRTHAGGTAETADCLAWPSVETKAAGLHRGGAMAPSACRRRSMSWTGRRWVKSSCRSIWRGPGSWSSTWVT